MLLRESNPFRNEGESGIGEGAGGRRGRYERQKVDFERKEGLEGGYDGGLLMRTVLLEVLPY